MGGNWNQPCRGYGCNGHGQQWNNKPSYPQNDGCYEICEEDCFRGGKGGKKGGFGPGYYNYCDDGPDDWGPDDYDYGPGYYSYNGFGGKGGKKGGFGGCTERCEVICPPKPKCDPSRTARDTTVVMNHVKSSVNSSNSEVVRRVALAARRVASVRVAVASTTTVRTIGVTVTTPATTVAREARRVATTVAVKRSAKKSAVTVPFTLDRSLLPSGAATTSTPITLLPRRAAITGRLYLPVE